MSDEIRARGKQTDRFSDSSQVLTRCHRRFHLHFLYFEAMMPTILRTHAHYE